MPKIKRVKCALRSPGEAPAVRFIPLREFQLWKCYMSHAHEKIVEGSEISIWVDAQSYAEQPPVQARPLEPVVRVDIQYWDQDFNTANLVQRFFPLEDYDIIKDTFLKHFPDHPAADGRTVAKKRVTEVRGYYLHPRLPHMSEV